MAEIRGSNSWRDELASLVDDPIGIRSFDARKSNVVLLDESVESEDLKDQVKGFARAWGELLLELGRGCRDIVQQSVVTEDSVLIQKMRKPVAKVSHRLRFLNEYLPEDRDPALAWPVILVVFLLALAVINLNTNNDNLVAPVRKVQIHPSGAMRVKLPDGRHIAYHELGIAVHKARYHVICPHPFLSSRLAGIPGVKISLLEEFGVRLITYDLPGFGESDPHPCRSLNSSASDMLHLANSVGVNDRFWVLAHSSGGMHAWAALKYIPHRIAGAAMFSPMVNPYERSMSKEESYGTWETWVRRRKFMYFLARRFPKLLSLFYRRSFLSGEHGQIDKLLSLSLGKKDKILIERTKFEEFWFRDVEESVRQGNTKPFIEEAMLQVSNWGFSLEDLRLQMKCKRKGLLSLLKSIFSPQECELAGFRGPIHIWQGMDDQVVPPSVTDYVARILPQAVVHKLQSEGHFSYFYLCDECHREIFSILFGAPQGPQGAPVKIDQTPYEVSIGEVSPLSETSTK